MIDPLRYTTRWPVRSYELDGNGHVNNAVYLNYAEQLTIEHAELSGFGKAWTQAHGGMWVIRRNEIDYLKPAGYGDMLELSVEVLLVRGVRGVRRTLIKSLPSGELLARVLTQWVWVRLSDGRPSRVPTELVEAAAPATKATLEAGGPGSHHRPADD